MDKTVTVLASTFVTRNIRVIGFDCPKTPNPTIVIFAV